MRLYSAPNTCSLASHIALREAGLGYETVKVDNRTKKTATGGDYLKINPKGYVPALELDDGTVLTENVAVLQYIADRKPQAALAPAAGTLERYRLQEWLGFVNSEIHKSYSPFFSPGSTDEVKQYHRRNLMKRLEWLETVLQGRTYLLGEQFTVADAYLFVVLRWSRAVEIDLNQWPAVKQYYSRVKARPHVVDAVNAESPK